jgi:hypothetical protein
VLDALRPGLHRWTARHPEWVADHEPGSPADWPPDVGSVAYAAPDAFVVVDPQAPADEAALWAELDPLVEAHGRPVTILTTMRFHRRSREALAARYGGALVSAGDEPPAGVRRVPIEGADESMVWLDAPRALVPGDRLIGNGRGGLRMCPESWLSYIEPPIGLDGLRQALAPVLELPVELVLASHGDPVLADAAMAVQRALRE